MPYRPAPSKGAGAEPLARLVLPAVNAAELGWGFLGEGEGAVGYLRVDGMTRYRESFEQGLAKGFMRPSSVFLTRVAAQAAGVEPSALENLPVGERLARVPSAAECFGALAAEMNRRATRTLIVDARRNGGGNSLAADILTACLFGPEAAARVAADGYQVLRHGPLYFDLYKSDNVEKVRERTGNPGFRVGDYDFSEERRWRERQRTGWTAAALAEARASWEAQARESVTFARLLDGPLREGRPLWTGRVLVVTGAQTYSAGFDLAAALHKLGATLVGVPSAQAGNCFIDTLGTTLTHSRIGVGTSFKASFLFPDDPMKGELLRPQRELTYGQMREFGFDPDASLLLALGEIGAPLPPLPSSADTATAK